VVKEVSQDQRIRDGAEKRAEPLSPAPMNCYLRKGFNEKHLRGYAFGLLSSSSDPDPTFFICRIRGQYNCDIQLIAIIYQSIPFVKHFFELF
jgi:hypothetical protein